jgi:hypothetical protein
MKSFLIALGLIFVSTSVALAAEPSPGEMWENSLITHKRNGTLAGPRPGQKCLWSARLNGCLYYTPGKWDLYLRDF